MTKERLFKELNAFMQELLIIEEELNNNKSLTSINAFYISWKQSNITTFLEEYETKMSSTLKLKIPLYFIIMCIIILSLLLLSMVKESISIFFITILIAFISIAFIIPKKKKSRLYKANPVSEIIQKINKQIEKNNVLLKSIKVSYSNGEKSLNDKLVMEIFDEANNNLSEMVNTEIVNLNYKDREYRKFLINLYDLKMSEKELNNFYRGVIKVLLEKDLKLVS